MKKQNFDPQSVEWTPLARAELTSRRIHAARKADECADAKQTGKVASIVLTAMALVSSCFAYANHKDYVTVPVPEPKVEMNLYEQLKYHQAVCRAQMLEKEQNKDVARSQALTTYAGFNWTVVGIVALGTLWAGRRQRHYESEKHDRNIAFKVYKRHRLTNRG